MIIRPMTVRERFNRVFRWERPDRVPDMEFGYWDKTIAVWHEQGLPGACRTNEDVERHLGLEGLSIIPEVPVRRGLFPAFEERTIERRGGRRLVRTKDGALAEMLEYDSSMPRYIKFAVETRADWDKLKEERLDLRAAVAGALRRITGQDLGQNPFVWERWWQENRRRLS